MCRKILIVIPRLLAGGSEKVLISIASGLDPARFDVHVAVLNGRGAQSPLPPHVHLHCFGKERVRYACFPLLGLIWKLRPNVVLTAGGPTGVVVTFVAKFAPPGTKVMVRQGTMLVPISSRQNTWKTRLYGWSLQSADRVICQAESMAKHMEKRLGIEPVRLRVLYNPVSTNTSGGRAHLKRGAGPQIMFVGRLVPEKRVELVIRSFAVVKRSHPAAILTILGDGPCRHELERIAAFEVPDGSVKFGGYQPDPISWMRDADVLVMASELEGLPNVALEALSVGCPVVSVACPGGLEEVAETTDQLVLVGNADPGSLAVAVSGALAPGRPRHAAPEAFWARFGSQRVLGQYEELLSK